jgi:pre-mRNA cleavage complex 2 protein Pcf11
MRYSPNDPKAYQEHLDWHFRMKRREKENAKRAQSRKWYFEQADWIISDEIEDNVNVALDEELAAAESNKPEIPTVPASTDTNENTCPVCHEEFDQFFKEENHADQDAGQWNLRNAIRPDGPGTRAYHPGCLNDAGKIHMQCDEEEEQPSSAAEANIKKEDASHQPDSEAVSSSEAVVEAVTDSSETPAEVIKTEKLDEDVPMETDAAKVPVVKEEPLEAVTASESVVAKEEPASESVVAKEEPMEAESVAENVNAEVIKKEIVEGEDESKDEETKEVSEEANDAAKEATEEAKEATEEDSNKDESKEVEQKPAETSLIELGNLTADAGVLNPPVFPTLGIKINITSQVSEISIISKK